MSDAFGTWQLDAVIAVGGLGEVWRAHRGDEVAAIKRLHTHLARNEDARAQFAVEQRLTAELPRHRHLVHAFEAGEVAGRPYIALELIDGEDVRRIVAPAATRDDPRPAHAIVPRARAIAFALAACDAAAHLHAHGYVHGDINPGNLVVEVEPDGDRAVLIDLGVARPIGQGGAVRGTHAYMAPEQVRGEAWSRATDVFAIGVVLWELIAGRRLFHRGPPWLSMAAVIEADVPALADPALDAIARTALAKQAADRTATADELARQLRAA
ncbi:MAG TPA: serine/threonine-protein kinase [Kofleriaceae bacterium]|nr:serine/threonine-protein kinase [Kofleriaceae bacterium]